MTDKEKVAELEDEVINLKDRIEQLAQDVEYAESESDSTEMQIESLEADIRNLEDSQSDWIGKISAILDTIFYTTSSDTMVEWINENNITEAILKIKKVICE